MEDDFWLESELQKCLIFPSNLSLGYKKFSGKRGLEKSVYNHSELVNLLLRDKEKGIRDKSRGSWVKGQGIREKG